VRRRPAHRWLPWLAAALAAAACGQPQPEAGERYLVIGASDTSAQRIAGKAKELAQRTGHAGLVVQVADCGDPRAMFAWAAEVKPDPAQAQQALQDVQRAVPDAYVKRCKVRPGSLLALRVPAVDPSIARVPAQVVNWSDGDRVSSIVPLGDAGRAVLVRRYQAARDDPLEGRRTQVALAAPGGELVTLVDDCPGAAQFVQKSGWIAFTCDSEQAADHVLHTVRAFGASGAPAATVPRCQQPAITADDALTCQGEEVDAAGRLRLTPRKRQLAQR
jgi:hypothetical protein